VVLTVYHSLARDSQEKRANHGTNKLPGTVQVPSGKQKRNAVGAASEEQGGLEASHRHGHGHVLTKTRGVVVAGVIRVVVPVHVHRVVYVEYRFLFFLRQTMPKFLEPFASDRCLPFVVCAGSLRIFEKPWSVESGFGLPYTLWMTDGDVWILYSKSKTKA